MSEPNILDALGSIVTEKILEEHPLIEKWSFNAIYVVCLDFEGTGPDPSGNSRPYTQNFNLILGYFNDINLADAAILEFVKSEKYKALEEAADDVCVYRKIVPAFSFNSAYNVVDNALDWLKEKELEE